MSGQGANVGGGAGSDESVPNMEPFMNNFFEFRDKWQTIVHGLRNDKGRLALELDIARRRRTPGPSTHPSTGSQPLGGTTSAELDAGKLIFDVNFRDKCGQLWLNRGTLYSDRDKYVIAVLKAWDEAPVKLSPQLKRIVLEADREHHGPFARRWRAHAKDLTGWLWY